MVFLFSKLKLYFYFNGLFFFNVMVGNESVGESEFEWEDMVFCFMFVV